LQVHGKKRAPKVKSPGFLIVRPACGAQTTFLLFGGVALNQTAHKMSIGPAASGLLLQSATRSVRVWSEFKRWVCRTFH
jgi:hypothetical protein